MKVLTPRNPIDKSWNWPLHSYISSITLLLEVTQIKVSTNLEKKETKVCCWFPQNEIEIVTPIIWSLHGENNKSKVGFLYNFDLEGLDHLFNYSMYVG